MSTLRIKDTEDGNGRKTRGKVLQSVVNFSHISLWIGIPLSVLLMLWQYIWNTDSYFTALPYYNLSVLLVWLSIIVELFTEPFFIVNQYDLNLADRSKYESVSVTVGSLVNLAVVVTVFNWKWLHPTGVSTESFRDGVCILAFALGKLARALMLLLFYYTNYLRTYASKKLFSLKLTRIEGTYYFQADIARHFRNVYFQICFKHLLNEADKLVINAFCTAEEQGVYSLLSNYGSLITRLVFAPIEESLRPFLSKLLTAPNDENVRLSMQVMMNLTKFYVYLSLMIILFGPTNSPFLLRLLVSAKWSTTSVLDAIQVYCLYLPFMALNGIFEAFFQSVAKGDQIMKYSYFMLACSCVFLFNSWILIGILGWSTIGLITSNIVSMILRIVYAGRFMESYYHYHRESLSKSDSKPLGSVAVNYSSLRQNFNGFVPILAVGVSMGILNWFVVGYVRSFKQLTLNVILAFMLFCFIVYKERESLRELLHKRRHKGAKTM